MKLTVTIILLAIASLGFSNNKYQVGFLPSVSLRKSLPANWSATFRVESRQSIWEEELKYENLLTDISLVATKRITPNITLGGGYLLRIDDEDDAFYHRILQQIVFSKRYPDFRLAHRLMTDQTFGNDENTRYRLRYRISAEIPLSGQSIDVKEYFVRLNNEYNNLLYDGNYDLEVRVGALVGYSLSPNNEIEMGVDYRFSGFVGGNPRSRVWLNLNFFHKF